VCYPIFESATGTAPLIENRYLLPIFVVVDQCQVVSHLSIEVVEDNHAPVQGPYRTRYGQWVLAAEGGDVEEYQILAIPKNYSMEQSNANDSTYRVQQREGLHHHKHTA
jgi:hypothetical protein